MTNSSEAISRADRLADEGRWDESAAIYLKLLDADPNSPGLRHNLATVLLQMGQVDEAIEQCRAAIRLCPDYPLALNTLGVALSRSGRPLEAIGALEAALLSNPQYANAAFNLGQALDQCGRQSAAIAAYRTALAIDPGLEAAAFELAVQGELPPPAKMPRSYAVNLFDTYARRFDEHLTELNYIAPAMLLAAVRDIHPGRFARAVDLGCGTGLAGATFRSHVEHLTGVDLSPAMMAAARERGVYDELIQGDVIDCLKSDALASGADLLLAADLLIYLGDLEPLFAAVASRLNPNGLFTFSIETTYGRDFLLQTTRRYAHAAEYIGRLAARHQLAELGCSAGQLRAQGEQGVTGLVFVLGSTVTNCGQTTLS